jgi:hypothetical protein
VSKHKDPKMLKGYMKPSLSTSLSSPILIDNAVSGVEECNDEENQDILSEEESAIQPLKRARRNDVTSSTSHDLTDTSKSHGSSGSNMPNFTFNFYGK